jgi:beta-phosphoglucomutase-like phosphatase (HAD superfamily)
MLYLAACRQLGADPKRSIAIEDATPGILAARSAGLLTLGLATTAGLRVEADRELTALWPLELQDLESLLVAGSGT